MRTIDSFVQRNDFVERWYVAGMNNSAALTTGVLSVNFIYALPFNSSRYGVIDRIGFRVTSVGSSAVARVGIYTNLSFYDVYPGSLVLDSGELSLGTTGTKSATIEQALEGNSVYWLVFHPGVSTATIRAIAIGGVFPVLGVDNAFNTPVGIGWKATQTYGALPANFPAGGTVLNAAPIPAIGVRYFV